MEKHLRLIGYARLSRLRDGDSTLGLESQQERIRGYCLANGAELVDLVIDADVGGNVRPEDRPGMAAALERLKRREADGLVAVRLDRFTRSVRDLLDLVAVAEKQKWALHSLSEKLDTGSACGRMIVTVLGAMAQMERELIGDRTRAALAERARRGGRVSGRPPLGYRFEAGATVPEPRETPFIDEVLRLRAAGVGARKMTLALEAIGPNPRTGRPWNCSTVAGILRTIARRARIGA